MNILQTTIVIMMLVQSAAVWTDKPIYGRLSGELLDPGLVQAGRVRERRRRSLMYTKRVRGRRPEARESEHSGWMTTSTRLTARRS